LASPEALDYRAERFPGTTAGLERLLVVPWNDRYTEEDVAYIGDAFEWAASSLKEGFQS
jgi:hypothetical protein